jgi:hypothetical protein
VTPQLTPENLSSIKICYNALISGNYKEMFPRTGLAHDKNGGYCAIAVFRGALNAHSPGWLDSISEKTGLPTEFLSTLQQAFDECGESFLTISERVHDYLFDNYHVDIAEPVSTPAPSIEAPHAQ